MIEKAEKAAAKAVEKAAVKAAKFAEKAAAKATAKVEKAAEKAEKRMEQTSQDASPGPKTPKRRAASAAVGTSSKKRKLDQYAER